MYRVRAYFLFILFIAIDWDNEIHSLLCIYVLMVNNPTSMYTDWYLDENKFLNK